MNATEDGAEPMGEAPEIALGRCQSRSVAGHRCTQPAGHDGPHGTWPAQRGPGAAVMLHRFPPRDAACITDTLDAINRGAVLGVLSAADAVTATKQLAERQTQGINAVRALHVVDEARGFCRCCWLPSPCPTIRALDEAGA
ncbi:hypothetical protein HGK72_26755 [Mycolicibacterium fortuitum]|uniref:hypothetical protein n=1 Tax=Mycolicibacterium fortuitum TaxID=1766 RepID=UPI00148F5727|nr:hypothetical protein [Mycolicibacterium fortuitum]